VLLNSVIIVLREVLEAMLLISIFAALSHSLMIRRDWIFVALFVGLIMAYIHYLNFDATSEWFDDAGQEIVNSLFLFAIYLSLLVFVVMLATSRSKKLPLVVPMVISVCLSIGLEGAEIMLYVGSFVAVPDQFFSVIAGGVFGAIIGLSVGILIYYFLLIFSARSILIAGYGLFLLVGAGMVSQAVRLLVQIDLLPAQNPVWDTSLWISETSVSGQLLYALVSYEATPTLLEVQYYLAAMGLMIVSTLLAVWLKNMRKGRADENL
jgi:high-affinity iron transporter